MRHTGTLELETDQLLLRRLLPQDAPQMYANWANYPAAVSYTHLDVYKRQQPYSGRSRTVP